MYIEQTLKKYLDDLANKKPTPGGGSVSALASALGTALLSMACNFTIGKPKYREVEEELKKFIEENESLRLRFMELIDLDVSTYEKVSQIKKLIRDNFGESDKHREKLQEAIKEAVTIPLEVCQLSIRVLKICANLLDKTNINLISDLSVSASLLKAGFQSAIVNVEINLSSLKDEAFIIEIRKILEPLIKESEIIPDLIQERVREKIARMGKD